MAEAIAQRKLDAGLISLEEFQMIVDCDALVEFDEEGGLDGQVLTSRAMTTAPSAADDARQQLALGEITLQQARSIIDSHLNSVVVSANFESGRNSEDEKKRIVDLVTQWRRESTPASGQSWLRWLWVDDAGSTSNQGEEPDAASGRTGSDVPAADDDGCSVRSSSLCSERLDPRVEQRLLRYSDAICAYNEAQAALGQQLRSDAHERDALTLALLATRDNGARARREKAQDEVEEAAPRGMRGDVAAVLENVEEEEEEEEEEEQPDEDGRRRTPPPCETQEIGRASWSDHGASSNASSSHSPQALPVESGSGCGGRTASGPSTPELAEPSHARVEGNESVGCGSSKGAAEAGGGTGAGIDTWFPGKRILERLLEGINSPPSPLPPPPVSPPPLLPGAQPSRALHASPSSQDSSWFPGKKLLERFSEDRSPVGGDAGGGGGDGRRISKEGTSPASVVGLERNEHEETQIEDVHRKGGGRRWKDGANPHENDPDAAAGSSSGGGLGHGRASASLGERESAGEGGRGSRVAKTGAAAASTWASAQSALAASLSQEAEFEAARAAAETELAAFEAKAASGRVELEGKVAALKQEVDQSFTALEQLSQELHNQAG